MWLKAVWDWFANNSTALQGVSSLVMATVTAILVWKTIQYVSATQEMLRVSRGQLRASLQPQLSPVFDYRWQGDVAKGVLILKNVGQYFFKLVEIRIEVYCSMSRGGCMAPMPFPLYHGRVLPANESVLIDFQCNPKADVIHLEGHDGPCDWVFRADIKVEDLFGLGEHHYSVDTALGIQYCSSVQTFGPKSRSARWARLRNGYRYWKWRGSVGSAGHARR
jgi:hypothetical protein